jgi:hypothetical protein
MSKPNNYDDMTADEREMVRREQAIEANQNRNNEMVNRRNQIADSYDDMRADDMDETDGERILSKNPDDTEAEAAEEDARAARARQELEQDDRPGNDRDDEDEQEEDEGDSKVINGETYYLQIVNGKKKWQSLREIRATAQKVESADEYLQNASASVKNAIKMTEQVPSQMDDEDLELELNKALMGDQESVRKLAQRLKATPSAVTPDVLQAVDERMTFRAAVDWFEGEYEKELSDPLLKKLIVEEDARLANEDPSMSYKKRLKIAGDSIRKWKNGISGQAEGTPPTSKKLERKQQMASAPVAGGRYREGDEPEAEETVADAIQAMAKKRGQSRAIQH